MRRYQRLTKTGDFTAVRQARRSSADELLVLMVRPNGLGTSRAGFSVSKRVGNAVVRNKTKRRLKEAVRRTPLETGWDLILIARKGASAANFQELSHSVKRLIGRAGIFSRPTREVTHLQKAKR